MVVPQSPVDFDDAKRLSNASVQSALSKHDSDDLKSLSLWDVVKLNYEELWHIFVGCVASLVMGATMPVFAIIFGEIIGVMFS